MNYRFACILATCLLATGMFHTARAQGKTEAKPSVSQDKNLRLFLTVEDAVKKPVTYSVVTAGEKANLSSVVDTMNIHGTQVPVFQNFRATLKALENNTYLVECSFGIEVPVIATTSSTTSGMLRSFYEYRRTGVETVAKVGLDEELIIMSESDKTVTLKVSKVKDQ